VVEIDPETYRVSMLCYVAAEDCGTVINPMIVGGQVDGGVAQGIDAALLEEVSLRQRGAAAHRQSAGLSRPMAPEILQIEVTLRAR
jgi:carbon-monoxide dehydrogenase large subunit